MRNVEIRHDESPWLLATYEEWQQEGGRPTSGRVTSVLFRRRLGLPQGLEWHHVHETWIERS